MTLSRGDIKEIGHLCGKAMSEVLQGWSTLFDARIFLGKIAARRTRMVAGSPPMPGPWMIMETRRVNGETGRAAEKVHLIFPEALALRVMARMMMLPPGCLREKLRSGATEEDLEAFLELANILFGTTNAAFDSSRCALRFSVKLDHLNVMAGPRAELEMRQGLHEGRVILVEMDLTMDAHEFKVIQVLPLPVAAMLLPEGRRPSDDSHSGSRAGAPAAPVPPAVPSGPGDADLADGARVLVVDDDDQIRSLVSRLLTSQGYRVTTAGDGLQALHHLHGESFDAVVLDVAMPAMDGYEVMRRIQTDSRMKELPVVFLSGKADPEARVMGLQMGAADFIGKPVESEEVLLRISNAVTLGKLRKEVRDLRENGKSSPTEPLGWAAGPPATPSFPSRRVLVVDDNHAICTVLRTLLKREGVEVYEANSGKEALGRLHRLHIDLILLDIMMPEMDGFETLRRIRRDPELRNIPVVMVTALGERSKVIKAIQLGAVDYIAKPFTGEVVRRKLAKILGSPTK